MPNNYIKLLLIFLFAGWLNAANAQNTDVLTTAFERYQNTTLQEKIYVHTDRSFYLTGELLWFKIYNVTAAEIKPVNISKVAYVEVLDDNNIAVLQAKIELSNGKGNGSLYLPVNLANGAYKLRAYTSWMKNFGAALFFEKQITIVNPTQAPQAAVKQINQKLDVQFFPEGGYLVNGLKSVVGIKTTGENGKGVPLNGVITNQRNDTIARFQSSALGMGRFAFTPRADDSYKAVMRVGTNDAVIKQLPEVKNKGYVINVTDNGNNSVNIKINGNGVADDVFLLAHNGKEVNLAQAIHLDAQHSAIVNLNKEKLGAGVNEFTLFDAEHRPLCQRLFFKRPQLLTVAAGVLPQYQTRKKVDVALVTNTNGQLKPANLSMSVFQADSLNQLSREGIAAYLWLSSNVKGRIENPDFYFSSINSTADEALDNLLITQGWSRFTWENVLSVKPATFKYLPEYNSHIVTAQITNADGSPAADKTAYLAVISKKDQLYGAVSDDTGKLLFNTRQLYANNEVVLQTNTMTDSGAYRISVISPFSDQYSTYKPATFPLNYKLSKQLDNRSVAMQVQNLYKPENMRYFQGVDSTNFYYNKSKTYLLDNFTRFTTLEEVLREYISEVNIVRQQQHFQIKIIDPWGFMLPAANPLVMIDGVPVFNIDKAFTIDPLKIRRLDILNEPYYYGPVVANGIISLKTYKTDLGGYELDARSVVLDYEGLQLQREFYSPVYENEQQQKNRLPDFRNLLFWKADINTNTSGKADISFYTSDKPGTYIGLVEGITADGFAGTQYFKFEVK